MSTKQFYLTLPSNVKSIGAENLISKYSTQLYKKLGFSEDENWSVGLAEISYNKSWFNITKCFEINFFVPKILTYIPTMLFRDGKFNLQAYADPLSDDISELDSLTENYCLITPGFYKDAEELVKVLNNLISRVPLTDKISKLPVISYISNSNRIAIKAGLYMTPYGENPFFPHFGEEIEDMLGLCNYDGKYFKDVAYEDSVSEEVERAFKNKLYFGCRPVQMHSAAHGLFVYCDIIEQNLVGDSYTQLLRIVEVPPKSLYGDQIVIKYDQPHYIPLQSKNFGIINLEVKDDTGDLIKFQYGRTVVKLIFRKDD